MIKKLLFLAILLAAMIANPVFSQINSGNPTVPFGSNTSYPNGIMPTNLPTSGTYLHAQAAADAYNAWKTDLVRSCTNGSRVLFDDGTSTVSEGIAYGMLLSAYAGDKALFDDLWKYYKANINGNGVMNWKMSSCDSKSGDNGATDAELDAAFALLVAAEQWPNATNPYKYSTEAQSLIGIIRQKEIHPTTYQTLNGDAWGTSNTCRNPSYFSPAYYRLFANVESSQSAFWNSTVSTAQSFLLSNRNASTGLVSNWADNNAAANNCNGANEFGFDAIRNPWRMATDVLWNGTSTASTGADICSKISAWANNYASNLKGPCAQNASNPGVGSYKNGTFSMLACAFMGTSGSTYQSALNSAYTNTVALGNNEVYFSRTIRCITLFMMTGNFWKPGGSIKLNPKIISAETNDAASSIILTFSKAINSPASTEKSNFTVKVNTITQAGAVTAVSLTNSTTVTLTLSATVTIAAGDNITISYTPGNITSAGDNLALEAVTNIPVSNKLAGNSTVVADCENGNMTNIDSYWFSYAAGSSTIDPNTDLVPFEMTPGGAKGTANAAVVTGALVKTGSPDYESAGIGFWLDTLEVPYDIRPGTGFSFWHKGNEVFFTVAMEGITQDKGYDHYALVPSHTNWTLVEVAFTDLVQPSWMATSTDATVKANVKPFDPSKVLKLQWVIKDGAARSYSYGIDEVIIEGLPSTVKVNKDALVAAISTAQTKYNAAVVGTSPGQYPQSAKTALYTAITTASAVYSDPAATQTQVNNAVTALNAAIATFDAAKIQAADKTVLASTIATANTKVANASVGTSPGQYPQSAVTALNTAITAASTVNSNATATQTEVNNAVTTLNTAIATFDAAKIPSTTIDVAALNAKIATAQLTLNAATIGTAVGNYPQSAATTFQAAIVSAQNIAASPSTQAQVDQAVTNLQTAITTFNASVITQASGNTLVADAENGALTKLNTEWYSYNDSKDGGASTVTPLSPFTMTPGGANGTANCAKITFELHKGTLGWDPSVGFGFAFLDPEAAYDLTGSTGISFWHKGESCKIQVALSTITNYNYYTTDVVAHPDWTYVTITWGMLAQLDWGANTDPKPWDLTKVVKIQWQKQAADLTAGSIFIDEVQIDGKILSLPVTVVNKAALVAKISEAQTLYNAAVVGTQTGQYPASAKTTFGTAINTAVTVNINASATQIEVDAAVTNLTDAIAAFQASKIVVTVDKTVLAATISTANSKITNASVGTNPGQYPQSAVTALNSAISAATTVNNNTAATQIEVNNAVTALNSAIATFDAAKIPVSTVDKTALVSAISTANSKITNASVGTNPGQYPQSAVTALNSAISAATTVNNNTAATQTEVNNAVTALNSAIATFDAAKIPDPTIDVTELETLITKAKSIFATAENKEGSGVGEYSVTSVSSFSAAIQSAELVATTATSNQDVSNAIDALNDAIFDLYYSALTQSISAANDLLSSSTIGTAVGEYPQSAANQLESEITTAGFVLNQATAYELLNNANSDLVAAVEVFLDAEITTGLDESEVSVSVYPNPTSDYISVVAEGLLSVTVVSTNGQIMIVEDNSIVDVSSLTSGVYRILVVTENGVATVSQIIK